jgi:hypothetical protein
MAARLTTLTSADVGRFERDGYVVVPQAFSPDAGLAMQRPARPGRVGAAEGLGRTAARGPASCGS